MQVLNIQARALNAPPVEVGKLIDSLASREDRLWPNYSWPRMEFDRPLSVGATCCHGPIRYFIEAYAPGQSIRFRFLGPKGFNGFHGYDIFATANNKAVLRHTLELTTHGRAIVTWLLAFRPMHDALIEDSLARAEASLGLVPSVHAWSPWVKLLRWVIAGGKAREQITPNIAL
ncbi:MAG TPA: SRPBCC family protein [Burkholderiales bacterium]|nr:SRPBCC family protein [Burkholderiales bacterium]